MCSSDLMALTFVLLVAVGQVGIYGHAALYDRNCPLSLVDSTNVFNSSGTGGNLILY